MSMLPGKTHLLGGLHLSRGFPWWVGANGHSEKGDVGTMTDKQYEQDRNRLIPFAVRKADQKMGFRKGRHEAAEWRDKWDQLYFAEMERLVRAEGVVR